MRSTTLDPNKKNPWDAKRILKCIILTAFSGLSKEKSTKAKLFAYTLQVCV